MTLVVLKRVVQSVGGVYRVALRRRKSLGKFREKRVPPIPLTNKKQRQKKLGVLGTKQQRRGGGHEGGPSISLGSGEHCMSLLWVGA